jgi:hypothetical protein
LKSLRKLNPDAAIFGLYGGDPGNADEYSGALWDGLDHFYVFPGERSARWKWENGDLMITSWFRDCGRDLDWDTIVVVRWDMLVFEPIERIFRDLNADEIFISGVRMVRDVEARWYWTSRLNGEARRRYDEFIDHLSPIAPAGFEALSSICIVLCLPRRFLERYSFIEKPELGFFEYRVPTYAKLFGIGFARLPGAEAWYPEYPEEFSGKRKYLIPIKLTIPLLEIYLEKLKPGGAVLFHPYYRPFELGPSRIALVLVQEWRAWLDFRMRALRAVITARPALRRTLKEAINALQRLNRTRPAERL